MTTEEIRMSRIWCVAQCLVRSKRELGNSKTQGVPYMPKRWKNRVPNTRIRCSSDPRVVYMGYTFEGGLSHEQPLTSSQVESMQVHVQPDLSRT